MEHFNVSSKMANRQDRTPDASRILLVDDDANHRMLVKEILSDDKYQITEAEGGARALEFIATQDFDVVLLDKRMPDIDGIKVCHEIRQRLKKDLLPILMVTGSNGLEELNASFKAGANDFIRKPYSPIELRARVDASIQRKRLTDQLDNTETVLFTLARMVEAKDRETGDHCSRLAHSAVAFGRELGFADSDLDALRRGGVLHDIGKLAIPESILLKNGPLDEAELKIMKQHTTIGAYLCSSLNSIGSTVDIIHYHHERWDGSGYPLGLSGEQIPLLARVFQLCDIYDALAHVRPYKKALPLEKIIAILEQEMAKGWRDPQLATIFIDILRRQPQLFQSATHDSSDLGYGLFEGVRSVN